MRVGVGGVIVRGRSYCGRFAVGGVIVRVGVGGVIVRGLL